jgi:hypothetical protein
MGTTGLIVVPLMLSPEITAGCFGLQGIAGRFISRRLHLKAKKHDEIKIIAESKLNSVKVSFQISSRWTAHLKRSITDTDKKINSARQDRGHEYNTNKSKRCEILCCSNVYGYEPPPVYSM